MLDEAGALTRRAMVKAGLALGGALAVPGAVAQTFGDRSTTAAANRAAAFDLPAMRPDAFVRPVTSARVVRPELMRAALTALGQHADRIRNRDRIAVVDFNAPSSQPRMHVIDIVSGDQQSFLVAHGSGSDPSHTGWLQRFSNDEGSNASCEGAFLAADYYNGHHGRSQRLHGLDDTNCNALSRSIVVHSAWYSNPEMLRTHGMLGRSQGCFAVGEAELQTVFDRLGEGRMIYAAKV